MPKGRATTKPKRDRAAYFRAYRARKRAAKVKSVPLPGPWPKSPAAELAAWSRDKLMVPPGHPKAGDPMELPDYGERFLSDALISRESALLVARKNAKSAVVAVYLLGRLVGPLRVDGWRGGVCSVNREKAGELWQQCEDIATASGLEGLIFRRAPRAIAGPSGSVDILSADRSAGHASGFDDAICDEIGLLREKDRELVNGLRSSVSARDGRFIALSIRGDSPFTAELLDRAGDPGVSVHHYTAPDGCELDDRAAWHAANPGLGSIKSLGYMAHEAQRALSTPADQAHFRAFDLNQVANPARVMLCDVADWRACEVEVPNLPPREGPCVVGFDLGGSSSMTAAAAYWLRTGRAEFWCAFPSVPDLAQRAEADGCRGLYQEMARRGELRTYPGRVLPVGAFLGDVAASLTGSKVVAAGADRFRRAEAEQALETAGVRWPMHWRGIGAGARADGSHDIRAMQRFILGGQIKTRPSRAMRAAIGNATLRFDGAGNPAIAKDSEKHRIDLLSAAVIAAGLAELHGREPKRSWRYRGSA